MSTFNMHEIKRQARKEAWYGDSYNPFRMTGRAKTWKPDLEPGYTDTRQSGILGDHFREDETPLSAVQCTPAVHTTDDPGKGDEQQSTPPRSEQTTCHRFLAQYNITKTVEVKSNKQTQVASTTDTSWELDTEKLSWDPFGCLSEKLSEPSYLHSTLRVLQSERMLKMESTQQLPARDVNFKGAGAPMTSIQNTKPQNIDVHLLTVTATTVQPVELFYDASDLLNTATTKPTQDPSGRLFVVEDVSPSLIEAFHNAFGCSMEVFSDHLRRAGEDVALVLPSISRRQPHVVIPYRRTYQPSSRKEIRESRNLRSSFSHGGLVTTEEHVTCWLSPTIDGSWTGIVLCDPDPVQSGNRSSNDECMRSRFETAIQSMSTPELLHDPFMIVRVLLQLVSTDWAKVIRDQEGYMLPGLKPQYTGATDVRLSEKESFGEYLKQTLGMLRMDLQIFQTLRTKSASFTDDPDELLADYEFLLNKSSVQIEQNTSSIPVITAMIAVEESRKAIQQANDVKALTTLATFYIPLSFVAGIFGMNVTQLNPNPVVNIPLWLYFATALPITAASMLLVWYWAWLRGCVTFIRQRFRRPVRLWYSNNKQDGRMESPLADALVKAGTVGVIVGPGKPTVNHGNFMYHKK